MQVSDFLSPQLSILAPTIGCKRNPDTLDNHA